MRLTPAIAGTALAISALAAGALTGESIGVVRAVTDASATGPDGTRALKPGSVIAAGELIATGAAGLAQIELTKGPRIAVAGDSSMTIAAIDSTGDAGGTDLEIEAFLGAARYDSADSTYKQTKFHTPRADISSSSTVFDFTVTKSGGTRLLLLEGEVTMCGTEPGGTCKTVATPCAMLRTDDGKDVEQVGSAAGSGDQSEGIAGAKTGTEVGLEQEIREHFPFQRSQSDLLEEFQFAGQLCAPTGGVSPVALGGSQIRVPPEVLIPLILIPVCIVVCGGGGGGPDATNHTN